MFSKLLRGTQATTLLAVLSLTASDILAQNLFVTVDNAGTGQMWTVTPAGVGTQVVFPAGTFLPDKASAFEVDQRTGDLLICHKPTPLSDITIYRTTVVGSMVTAQTPIFSVPGTGSFIPQYLYRESTGGFLLLSYHDTTLWDFRIHRLGVTLTGGFAVDVPYLDTPGSPFLTDICSNAAGQIYLTGPVNGTSVVWTVPAIGGVPTTLASPVSNQMTYYSIETTATGGILVGGVPRSLVPLWPSLICPNGTSTAYNAAVDLHRQANGDILVVDNVPGGSDVRLFAAGTCGGGGGGGFAWVAPVGVLLFKATRAEATPSILYGSPCPIGAGTLPLITQTTPPLIGTNWTIDLTGGAPLTPCALFIGLAEMVPLQLTATCAAFQTADIVVSPFATNAAGSLTFVQAVPLDPTIIGFPFYPQWAIYDNAAPGGAAVTAAIASVIM